MMTFRHMVGLVKRNMVGVSEYAMGSLDFILKAYKIITLTFSEHVLVL